MNSGHNIEIDALVQSLIELSLQLRNKGIPLIIGGGLSMYLRNVYLPMERSPRYPQRIAQRSTKDIDIFLYGDVIVDSEKAAIIRDALRALNYESITKYFQFHKLTTKGDVRIDILASLPSLNMKGKCKINRPRIGNPEVKQFHAFLVDEATDIEIGIIPIEHIGDSDLDNVFVPSSFNYVILKLHAFRDRRDDEAMDLGRHHAFDIFSAVTDMDEADWKNAQQHYGMKSGEKYIQAARKIVEDYFSDGTALGILRIKENELYQRYKQEYDRYIDSFISDLKEMFFLQ